MKVFESKNISISVNRSPAQVYDFISNRENLPLWASGLESMENIKIKFAEKNIFGVVDHDVTLATGTTFHNPMRVLPNGDGSEVVFTLFRRPEMSNDKFESDANWVLGDLKKLKSILESN